MDQLVVLRAGSHTWQVLLGLTVPALYVTPLMVQPVGGGDVEQELDTPSHVTLGGLPVGAAEQALAPEQVRLVPSEQYTVT
ncbi:hypothetical protein [Pyxidicoccus trucidator]|uniref:hypothetical protein n=1 Tax=Pyxidicoccus trucidator TaxID=2709662 RepID=UPI0013DB6F3C|nr:hypothetical protein [Pyxidicoccus trucidator]